MCIVDIWFHLQTSYMLLHLMFISTYKVDIDTIIIILICRWED